MHIFFAVEPNPNSASPTLKKSTPLNKTMKNILYLCPELKNPNHYANQNWIEPIEQIADQVIKIDFAYELIEQGYEGFNSYIRQIVKNSSFDIIVYFCRTYELNTDTLRLFKKCKSKFFIFFSDDNWRRCSYDRYLALYSNLFAIAVPEHVKLYKKWGLPNLYLYQWACNPKHFFPIEGVEKKYDVTFIGAAYGKRIEYVRYLKQNGINITVFGQNWAKYRNLKSIWSGYLPADQINRVINETKINLSFIWTSRSDGSLQVKGRNAELAASKGFQISNVGLSQLEQFFKAGETIVYFESKEDLLKKIKYYLEHDDKREEIAQKSYKNILSNHTWEKYFKEIFSVIKKDGNKLNLVYKILVISLSSKRLKLDITHPCLNLDLCKLDDLSSYKIKNYTGCVYVDNPNILNSETLYLQAFALHNDGTDAVLTDFFIKHDNGLKEWVYFMEDGLTKHIKSFLNKIPKSALMFSSNLKCEAEGFSEAVRKVNINKLSLINYPSFSLQYRNIKNKFDLLFTRLMYSNLEFRTTYKKLKRKGDYLSIIRLIMLRSLQKVYRRFKGCV